MKSAIVLVPKDKETKSIYFDDKGLRLTITMDYAVVATGGHQHVFRNIVPSGVSRPYIYVKRFVDLAFENDCVVRDQKGNATHSYSKLMAVLKEKEDKRDFNIAWYVDLWLNNIFAPLYSIEETEVGSFLVYEQYMHNIARQHVLLMEKKDDMTNKQFIDRTIENLRSYMAEMDERVLFPKETDEEALEKESKALEEQAQQSQVAK